MIWKAIPGYLDYQVSDQGQVRSLARIIDVAGDQRRESYRKRVSGRILKSALDAAGYPSVGGPLGRIHVLVMLAFVGRCPDAMEVCHNNGDKTDCRLSNLRYGTSVENQADKLLHGTHNRGERHGQHKLTAEQVIAIRNAKGTNRAVGTAFDVSEACVRLIKARQRWGWL